MGFTDNEILAALSALKWKSAFEIERALCEARGYRPWSFLSLWGASKWDSLIKLELEGCVEYRKRETPALFEGPGEWKLTEAGVRRKVEAHETESAGVLILKTSE